MERTIHRCSSTPGPLGRAAQALSLGALLLLGSAGLGQANDGLGLAPQAGPQSDDAVAGTQGTSSADAPRSHSILLVDPLAELLAAIEAELHGEEPTAHAASFGGSAGRAGASALDEGWTPHEVAQRRNVYARVLALGLDAESLAAVRLLEALDRDEARGILSEDVVRALLAQVRAVEPGSSLAREASLLEAHLLGRYELYTAERFVQARSILERLAAFPETEIAPLAAQLLWRLRHFEPGQPVPDLCGIDAFGNQVCADELRGQFLVIRFWSFGDAGIRETLEQDVAMVRRFWDDPFEFVGINRDADREYYLARRDDLGLPGIQLYEGPVDPRLNPAVRARTADMTSAFTSWRQEGTGSTFVIDAAGNLVSINLEGEALFRRVRDIIDAHYERRRSHALQQEEAESAGADERGFEQRPKTESR